MLSIQGLKKTYTQPGVEISVLKQVDLEIAAGETVAIIGQSGAGKSTLLALMAGLDKPTEGQIVMVDRHLESMSEAELASFRAESMGIVFQQFHLISTLTAWENVSLPLEIRKDPEARAKAKSALTQVGLAERLQHFPSKLSGGECQRVAIARAFVTQPRILLADEPSGNLDSDTGHSVMDLLFEMAAAQKTTMILVTHSERLAQRCNQQYELTGGQLQRVNL